MEADKKLKIKEEPFDSENLFKDSEGREHLHTPYQEVVENNVKKEIPEISDNFQYENCDFQYENCDSFEHGIGDFETKLETLDESLEANNLHTFSVETQIKVNLLRGIDYKTVRK